MTHLFTNTSRVVRYSDTTRSSFLTMSFKLRFCKFPLAIQTLQWLYINVLIHVINLILQFELSLTVVCAQVSADLFLYHCMLKFGILTLWPPVKHPDKTNIYQMNNWEVPQTLWLCALFWFMLKRNLYFICSWIWNPVQLYLYNVIHMDTGYIVTFASHKLRI